MNDAETLTSNDNENSLSLLEQVDEWRQQGNHQFRLQRYETAVQLYSLAIHSLEQALLNETNNTVEHDSEETMPNGSAQQQQTEHSAHPSQQSQIQSLLIVNYCNRSACHAKMQEYDEAKSNAQRALHLDPHNLKASFRLVSALLALHDYEVAKQVIQSAMEQMDSVADAAAASDANAVTERQGDATVADTTLEATTAAAPSSVDGQRKAFESLWNHCLEAALVARPAADNNSRTVNYASLSIKDFIKDPNVSLGSGNFTEVYLVTHKTTGKQFALKQISKQQAADLAKRQHPNVWNEIQMERRVLMERLTINHGDENNQFDAGRRFVIQMYATFQDYNSLYYLMELHHQWGDLWSELRIAAWNAKNDEQQHAQQPTITRFMVGAHPSQTKIWMYELVAALEFIHSRGIVHRDIKPENIMLNRHGHIVLLDFGTAKDLIETDLNGPEFVGTPDFMSPESVEGKGDEQKSGADEVGALHTSDLWALGCVLYILQAGRTPFWCPSPYLAFLKIKRCNLVRAPGIVDDNAWDLIQKLLQLDPTKRIGADAFSLCVSSDGKRSMQAKPGGYDEIRNHPYFKSVRKELPRALHVTPVPSLRDLCIRAVAELAHEDSLSLEVCDEHPPGDGSSHDMMRLNPDDRAAVMHILERMKLLREPRLYARFFEDQYLCRLDRVRPISRDFVGLTQMTDDQGKAPRATVNDPHGKPVDLGATRIVHMTNPLFVRQLNESCLEEQRKEWIKLLKKSISAVNRKRPKLCVAAGYLDEKCRKLLSRISETIPVVCHDGSAFFSFWILGIQCIALTSSEEAFGRDSPQMAWLREHLEQCRMSKHPLFVFVDTDPRSLPKSLQRRLARGRALGLYGVTDQDTFQDKASYVVSPVKRLSDDDDDRSVRSTSSEEDAKDEFTMAIHGTKQNCLRWITVHDEPGDWDEELDEIDADGNETPLQSSRRYQEPLDF
ncbi:hypothetical protein MPSEU_000874500 [Mayamaea pseudoterrestris]|nr:hypothetical protein MPSEU_000874500 [Mayamaea pseudoterrestris]